jgi:F-type H+-transporting ATPase subunit gamma
MAQAKVLIKRRKSVRNTEKITRTMEMVSTVKYKQSYGRIASSGPYQEKLRELMADLAGAGARASHPLLESREVRRSLILLLTSNRGLCGAYNANLIATARERLELERGEGAEATLEIVGKKGAQYFRFIGQPIGAEHHHFSDRPRFPDVNALAEDYIERYTTGEIDRVVIVYQKFFSAGRQRPVAEVLLPLVAESVAEETAGGTVAGVAAAPRGEVDYIYSPDPDSLMRELMPAYFKTTMYNDFLHAAVGEHLARMVAMKNATDAANKLIRTLTRMYNRARQSQITNEIAELMGGVEALK